MGSNTHQPKNKPINIRRGEGGGAGLGGPLWSPVVGPLHRPTIPYTSKLAPTNSWFPIFPISGTQAAQFDYDLQRDSPLRYSS